MNESDFIAALRTLPLHPGARGLRDDAAVLEIGGETLVLTHDMIAEGIHYLLGTDLADVAWKLVAVNLSDLAAKGATPVGVLLGACLSDDSARFVEGLREILAAYDVPLLGGDTIGLAPGADKVFGCTAIGRATGPVPSRSGAVPGDALWVTGVIGAAMLGCESAQAGQTRTKDQDAYFRPVPRLAEGRALAPSVHAMCDVSDGLLLDARRIAEASGCTVAIDLSAIPFAAGLRDADTARRIGAASWGDDYELLFAAPADFVPPITATRVGHFADSGPAPLLLDGAPPPGPMGYEHR